MLEDKARRCLEEQLCGWSLLLLQHHLGNQIYAGALQGHGVALGDSDKLAGKTPSEMQK